MPQLKNIDKATKELNRLIQLNPNEPKYYGMLGEIYQNAGQKEKAKQAYDALLKIDPGNPFVHLSKKYIGKAFDNGARENGVILEHYGDIFLSSGKQKMPLNIGTMP